MNDRSVVGRPHERSPSPLLILALALLVLACEARGTRDPSLATAASGPGPSTEPARPANNRPARLQVVEGTVAEHLDARPYSFLRVDTGQGSVWVAVREPARDGDRVRVDVLMPLEKFESRVLDRKFDRVYLGILEQQKAVTGRLASAQGTMSVEDVWKRRKELNGRVVSIHGQVIGLAPDMFQRDFLKVKDGTGGAGEDEITVTTTQAVQVGDVVTITGTVRVAERFGNGPPYPVMLEDGTIARAP